jgi:hypothetical protein
MLHTIYIPKRALLDIDETHHEISSYGRQCLKEFKGGNIVVKQCNTTFTIVDYHEIVEEINDTNSSTAKYQIAFAHWTPEVENLDVGKNESDEAMCFNFSNNLKWNDVNLGYGGNTAPTIERLTEALSHVYICAWCPLDI